MDIERNGMEVPKPPSMKKRILILDDEWAILELLRIKLVRYGFEVATARNEREFWTLAFEKRPDLLILDIWLGNQGESTRLYDDAVRAGFDSNVPVIFISALVEDGSPPKRPSDGGRFVLYGKPFDFDLLLEDIRKLTCVSEA